MIDINQYLDNGTIEREKIVNDIKIRKLSHNDIEELVSNQKVQDAFIGDTYQDKVDKKKWTEEYLNELSCAVVGESFNSDYLFYLEEVAEHVFKKHNYKMRFYNIILFVLVLILLILIAIAILSVFKDEINW
ncbi:MAG: hypothetical protein E6583_03845 [Clostridium sp.]|nr:hypothetical protein [Clostridium sp.]